MMPLALATPGIQFKILKINGRSKAKNHLTNMGFIPGAKVELISINHGNIICKIKDSRVAVDRDLAMKIMI